MGRILRLHLGETGVMRFTYDDDGLFSKEFVDLTTSRRLYWARRPSYAVDGQHPRTREALNALLPGYGTVAELDTTVSNSGLVVANLLGRPYALIPFANPGPSYNASMPVRRVINLSPQDQPEPLIDRIEYNDEEIIVRFSTWQEMAGAPPHRIAISLPRKQASVAPVTFNPASSWMPNISNMKVRLSTGMTAAMEALLQDNDDGSQACTGVTTDFCITVTTEGPPPLPQYPNEGNGGSGGGNSGGNGNGDLNPYQIADMTTRNNVEKAIKKAIEFLTLKKECADLFKKEYNWKNNPPMTQNWAEAHGRIYRIRDGQGVLDSNGVAVCDESPGVMMWMDGPKKNTLNVCSGFKNVTFDQEGARFYIHELLHTAGARESNNQRSNLLAKYRHDQIHGMVTEACRP